MKNTLTSRATAAVVAMLIMASAVAAVAQTRIVGGNQATEGDYPWMVALVEKGVSAANGQFCGGALIAPDWVATAAHCAEGVTPNNTEVIVGAYDLRDSNSGQRIGITEVKIHQNYRGSDDDVSYDIALFRLARSVNDVPAIPLVSSADQVAAGTVATVMGFGLTSETGETGATTLRDVEVPIVSFAEANAVYGNLNESHLAAGLAEGGRDSCQGDSGGPLVVRHEDQWHLAGIVSFGDGCARPGAYGVYAHVFNLRNWITDTMSGVPNPDPVDPDPVDPDPVDPDPGNGGGDDHADDIAGATIVSTSSLTNGSLESAWDFDVFTFELASPATVTIETLGTTDTYGYLESDNGYITEDDSSGTGGNFRIMEALDPGVYYVFVEAFDPSTGTGNYQLKVSTDGEAVLQPDIVVYHDDDVVDSDRVIDLGERLVNRGDSSENLTISNEGEGDLFIQSAVLGGRDASQFRLTVQPSDEVSPNRSTGVTIAYDPSAAGVHQAQLSITSNDPDQPRYVIHLRGTGVAPSQGADDHGDDESSATLISAPGTAEGELTEGGDVDVFAFEITARRKVIIRSTGDTDTYGTLLNADGDIVAEDDDRGSGFNFRLRRRLDPGTYYVAVEGYDETVAGEYGLTIRVR